MITLRETPSGEDVAGPARYEARELVGAGRTATILLDGQAYVLRITRAGKLILTK